MIAERDVEAPGPLGPLRGVMTLCGRADASPPRPDVARADFPAMTHAPKDAASDLPADNFATYAREDLPLTPGLAERVAGFIHALR